MLRVPPRLLSPVHAMRTLAILSLLAAALAAQNHRVTPLLARNAEANGNNSIPWWSATHRYQQVQGDLRNVAMQIRELALRRDGGAGTLPTAIARTVDLD